MKRKFQGKIIALLLLLICLSCRKQDKAGDACQTILIDNSRIPDEQDISMLIDSVSVLPLKETKGNYIGSVYKLIASGDRYIVFDRQNTGKINLFDVNGNFIKTVISIGDGPNDALNTTDCWIGKQNKLEVYDYAQMKVFLFDTAFNIRSVVRADQFNHFVSLRRIPHSDHYVGYANYNDDNPPFRGKYYQIAILDGSLRVTAADRYFDRSFRGMPWLIYKQHFFEYRDSLRFFKTYDNFVYDIILTGVVKRFKIGYRENPLPDKIEDLIRDNLDKYQNAAILPNEKAAILKRYTRLSGNWLENEKYICFASRDGTGEFGQYFFSIAEKSSNKVLCNARRFADRKRYKLVLPPLEYFDDRRNEFIGVVNGETLRNLLLPGSLLADRVNGSPEILYLVKIKLK